MNNFFWLPSIKIKGYRPFNDILFRFRPLQVIVGANGSGKSSLFEFLKFLRDACYQDCDKLENKCAQNFGLFLDNLLEIIRQKERE
jgi:predicted ATPase